MIPAADPRRAFHLGVVIFSGSLPATLLPSEVSIRCS